MQVHQVMSQPVDVISPSATIREAARRMRDENIGSLPVGDNGQLIGMVTDRDIVARAVAENLLPSNAAVGTVMSQGLYYCFEDETLVQAAQIMAQHQVRRLPVLNRNQQLVGIIAIADIACTGYREAQDTAIEGVSQPIRPAASLKESGAIA
jgi:CBS domain-containing protein